MSKENRSIFINAIIGVLKEQVAKKNKELVKHNLYWKQEVFDAFDMLLKLAVLDDKELNKIAKACGI